MQQFTSLDIQQQLSRHLLKTLGLELTSELLLYVVQESPVAIETKDLTSEVRYQLTLPSAVHILTFCLPSAIDPTEIDR